jgi:FKBP-type peptidyl-prolyl cis-trans isomerase
MAQNWVLRIGAGLALAGLLLAAGCTKKQDKTAGTENKPPQGSSAATPGGGPPSAPSAANDRTPVDEGELKGGENVEGAPALMSEDAFLAEYKKLPGVFVRPSGVMYRIIESGPGSGKSPKQTDKVRVAYKGSLMDGSVFDQTTQGQTSSFSLGDTIVGWQEALPLMKVGDAWEIVIPSALAYGDKGASANGQQVIPPNTPLVFDIKLFEVGVK